MVLVIIIRDGSKVSLKADFVKQIIKLNCNASFLNVFRKEQFEEKWRDGEIELDTSTFGKLMQYILISFLKSPKDQHDEIIRRLRRAKLEARIRAGGFVTILLSVIYQYFGRSARIDRLKHLLEKEGSKKIFLIDEFYSLNTVSLRMLQKFGTIIYVSSDVARDFYGVNLAAAKIMSKFEQKFIALPDIVVACSERDRLKYVEMGARKAIFYPNIYPIQGLDLFNKDQQPSIVIVLREHWGSLADKALNEVLKALACLDERIRLYMIGIKPEKVPENVCVNHYSYIQSRSEFLRILSKSWFGINLGIHGGGSNQRKFDYALAQLVVLSDNFGTRGDFLPCEYTYVDHYDLAAKLKQLIALGRKEITKMGEQNRKEANSLADRQHEELLKMIDYIFSHA